MEKRHIGQGFGLIEVMIALVVIAVGALALTQAQFGGLHAAQDAHMRTMANILVQDMVSRIQANPGDAIYGGSSCTRKGNSYGSQNYVQSPQGLINNNCYSSTGEICDGCTMAMNEAADWAQLIQSSFPSLSGAFGLVCIEASPGDPSPHCAAGPASPVIPPIFTVKLFWNSFKNQGTQVYDQSVITTVELPLQRVS